MKCKNFLKGESISFIKDNKDTELNYDHLIFATDPITPSKLIKGFKHDIELDEIGTSGKVTAFFRNPVKWKDSNEYSDSFRFIFSNNNLNNFEEESQNALKNSGDYFAGFIQTLYLLKVILDLMRQHGVIGNKIYVRRRYRRSRR